MQDNLDLIGGVAALCAGSFAGIKAYMLRAGFVNARFSATLWVVLSVFFLNQAIYLFLQYQGFYNFGYEVFTIAINIVASIYTAYEFFTRR